MDMINYRYTMLEYKELTAGIVGDLVRLNMGEENLGVGVVLKHRRYHGEIHLKIAWLCSPHIRFKSERTLGWHNYERIRFISSIGERKECL
jgi:hypothetical protein